jgi:hypothetical protein
MKKKTPAALALLLFASCAQPVWVKPGARQQDFYMDSGQCKAQGFSVANANALQVALVYNSCMRGKGWHQTTAPAQTADANTAGEAFRSNPPPYDLAKCLQQSAFVDIDKCMEIRGHDRIPDCTANRPDCFN